MSYQTFCLFLMTMLLSSPAGAEAPPPPVEYVLGAADYVSTRDEYPREFEEQVETRGAGDRADRWITGVTTPSITLYLPKGKPTAAAVVCPGGGYAGLSFDKEGTFIAKWLCQRGVAAGVLKYSVRTDERYPLKELPLGDAHYAIRFMKTKVGGRVGIVGFSAGGHLAATAANQVKRGEIYDGSSPIVSHDTDVDFHALIYPVISMKEAMTHGASRTNLIGKDPSEELIRRFSIEEQVTSDTPPALLVSTMDDRAVPPAGSLRYFEACQSAGVPAELHVYPEGGHGYGMWKQEGTVAEWPAAFEKWLKSLGVINAD